MGLLRVLLALSVLASHAGRESGTFGLKLINGREAVVLFYIISGFYMAMILNRKYVGPGSAWRFYLARALRLWPTYFLALLFAVYVKHDTGLWHRFWRPVAALPLLPRLGVLFSNLFIVGQDSAFFFSFSAKNPLFWAPYGVVHDSVHNGFRLLVNMPAYTVSIEILFYLIAPFIVRSLRRTVVFFLIGELYHLLLFYWFKQTAIAWTYHCFAASYLYFGAGALVYHLSQRDLRIRGAADYALGLALVVMLLLSNLLLPGMTILFFALAVPGLFRMTRQHRLDRALGELSYTIYIFHLPMLDFLLPRVSRPNLAWIGALCTLGVAVLVYLAVERPVNRWRSRLAAAPPKPAEVIPEREPCERVA